MNHVGGTCETSNQHECAHFNQNENTFDVECFGCKRYHPDLFTPRKRDIIMDHKTLVTIVAARRRKTEFTLHAKAREYATTDRLHNFNRAALLMNISPIDALFGMAIKHFVSILDLITGFPKSKTLVDEKIGDLINYLILLEAMTSLLPFTKGEQKTMSPKTFNSILERRLNEIKFEFKDPHPEDEDFLKQFKLAGLAINTKPRVALVGLMAEQWVKIVSLTKEEQNIGWSTINETIGTLIHKLILLEALLLEECGQEP